MVNIELLKTNNQKEITKTYNLYYRQIYNNVYNIIPNTEIVEDLVNEIFIKAFKNIDKYVVNISFICWLKTIANNHTIDFLRKNKNQQKNISIDDSNNLIQLQQVCGSPEESLIEKESIIEMLEQMDLLPSVQKDLLKKRFFEGKSYEIMAKELNIPIGTVKSYLNKAKKNLKQKVS